MGHLTASPTQLSVIIVGATGGIGRRLTQELADRGARLTVGARSRADLDALTVDAVRCTVDVCDPASVDAVLDAAGDGSIDVVVDVSGVVALGPLTSLEPDVVRTSVETDLLGPILLTRAAIPRLAPGGRVVFAGAVTAENPTAGLAVHSAAKAGLAAFVTAMRHELREQEIDLIEVRLPHVETGLEHRAIAGSPDDVTLPDPVPVEAAVDALIDAIYGSPSGSAPSDIREAVC